MTDVFIKISAVLVITAVFTVLIKQYKPEYAMLLSITAVIFAVLIILENLLGAINRVKDIFSASGNALSYFTVAFKALGISYISGFAADTCRDFGQSSLASKAEFAGKCAIFVLSVPLMCNVLEKALEFAGL